MKKTNTKRQLIKKAFAMFLITQLAISSTPLGLYANKSLSSSEPTSYEVQAGYNTNLENIQGLQGTWSEEPNGLYSQGSGDCFAISDTTGTDFVYSAEITFDADKFGAGSLVFRSNDNCSTSYVANVDRQRQDARIFKFVAGRYVGDILGGSVPLNKLKYNMRVEAIGKQLKLYVDDVLIGSGIDNDPLLEGKFGLLTFNSSITYQNVIQKAVSKETLPKLTNLEIDGASIAFDPNTSTYSALVENEVDSVVVTPSTSLGNEMKINAVNEKAEILLAEQAIASGMASPEIPLSVGSNTINIKLKNEDGVEIIVSINIERAIDVSTAYLEPYRPQFHFTTLKNFINDPNGLVFDPSNETWHMFYQYNPTGMSIGNQVWGHAESTDLVTWRELPIAIPQGDGLGAIFSGSAVVDEDNTSGFFSDNQEGESKLVAIFTHDGGDQTYGNEKQSIASSKDHGLTWDLYDGNPVVKNPGNMYGRDFRDPKVIWHDNKWIMIVAGGRGRIFSSDNLIDWEHESDLFHLDGGELHSECPDLYPLQIEGTNEIKWIYTASGVWYIIGDLVKNDQGKYEFKPETGAITYSSSTGYATQSYYNDGTGQNRRLAVSWLQDYTASAVGHDKVWNGTQTIPQVIKLQYVNGNLRLVSYPVDEIKQLRSSEPVFTFENEIVSEETPNLLSAVAGKKYDLEAQINMGTATEVGFNIMTGDGKHATVKYNDISKQFVFDRSAVSYGAGPAIASTAMQKDAEGNVKFRIIVDVSVLEAFGNDGEAAANHVFFANVENTGLEFYAVGGQATVTDLKIYDMKSMFRDDLGGTVATQVALATSVDKDNIEVGETFTVTAAVMPMTATNKNVTWASIDDSIFETISQQANSITLKALKIGAADVKATAVDADVSKSITLNVRPVSFITNMTDWKGTSGVWKKTINGYSSQNISMGDSFAMSEQVGSAFIYEATIDNFDGTAAGIAFGVTNPASPTSAPWYCINIEKGSNYTAKLFKNRGTGEVWNETKPLTEAQRNATSFKLKIVVSEVGQMNYYLDDVLVAQRLDPDFAGGGLGLLTFRSNADFNNVNMYALEQKLEGNIDITTIDGNTAKAYFTLNNNTDENAKIVYAIATYDQKGRMSGYKEMESVFNANTMDNEPLDLDLEIGHTAKAFMWRMSHEDFNDSYVPICDAAELIILN